MLTRNIAMLFAAALLASDAAAENSAVFMAACAKCHPSAKVLAGRIKGANDAERSAALRERLKRHHAPDPSAVDQLTAYLLSLR